MDKQAGGYQPVERLVIVVEILRVGDGQVTRASSANEALAFLTDSSLRSVSAYRINSCRTHSK